MYRQYDQSYSPTRSGNAIDDMDKRLNAVINANEKLVQHIIIKNLLLREKMQENEQLKDNIDILYNNNQELSEINLQLCEQVQRCKNSRCQSYHQRNLLEQDQELESLKQQLKEKDKEILNYQQHFEDELQLELTQKEYVLYNNIKVEKIKGLEDQNQQLIKELDLVTKKLIQSQRGSILNNQNKELEQFQQIIEDLQLQLDSMHQTINQKDEELQRITNEVDKLKIEKRTISLQLDQERNLIIQIQEENNEKSLIIEQLKKNHSLNSTKNEIIQKKVPAKPNPIRIESNVLELSDDIDATVKRKSQYEYQSEKQSYSARRITNPRSPKSQISESDQYLQICEKLQSDLQQKDRQLFELLKEKRFVEGENEKLVKFIQDLENSLEEKQALIEQFDNEIKNNQRSIRRKDNEHKSTIMKQQEDVQVYEERIRALENLSKDQEKIYEKQASQTQNLIKSKDQEIKRLTDELREIGKIRESLRLLLQENKEYQNSISQKDRIEQELSNKLAAFESQLRTKEFENKNLKEKVCNQGKIYELESQIVELKLELDQHIINAEIQQDILLKNEQQLKIRDMQYTKLQEQLKDSQNKQKEIITMRELENQKYYQQIDDLNDLLRQQDFEIKKLQSQHIQKQTDKAIGYQSEIIALQEQIDRLQQENSKSQSNILLLETQLKGKEQEIIINHQKQLLQATELETKMKLQQSELNERLIEKEKQIQQLQNQLLTLKEANDIALNDQQLVCQQIEIISNDALNSTFGSLNSGRMDQLKEFTVSLENKSKQELLKQLIGLKQSDILKEEQNQIQLQSINEQNELVKVIQLEKQQLQEQIDLKSAEINGQQNQIQNLENQLKGKEQSLKKLQVDSKDLEQQKQIVAQFRKQNEQLQQQDQKLQDTILSQDKQIKNKEDQIKKQQDQIKELNKKVDQALKEVNSNKQIKEQADKIQDQLTKKSQEVDQLQQQLQNQKKSEDQMKKLQQQLDASSDKNKKQTQEFEKKISDLLKQLQDTNDQLQEWEQNDLSKDQEIENLNKKIDEWKKKENQFQKQSKLLKDLQDQLKNVEQQNNQLKLEQQTSSKDVICQRDNLEQENKELREQTVKLQRLNAELAYQYENIQYVDAKKMQELARKIECFELYHQQQEQKSNDPKTAVTPRKESQRSRSMKKQANTNDKLESMTIEELRQYIQQLEQQLSNKNTD